MEERLICAGFGGQGIMMLGRLIAYTAMRKNLKVTWMPSYGAEVRGGTAHCMVSISNKYIASPIIDFCHTAILMNKPSYDRFSKRVHRHGLIIANTSLIQDIKNKKDIKILKVPLTDMAYKLGNIRAANMIALGIYMRHKKISDKKTIEKGIRIAFAGKADVIDINIKAFKKGFDLA